MSTTKLDPDVKALWVANLRSGEYRQTRGKLRNRQRAMCCIGVYCDTVDPTGWDPFIENHGEPERVVDGEGNPTFRWRDLQPTDIPDEIRRLTARVPKKALPKGLAHCISTIEARGGIVTIRVGSTLMALNDDAKWSFARIADFVEKYL